MFEILIVCGYKFSGTYNAGIGKISRTIAEAVYPADFEVLLALIFQNAFLDCLGGSFFKPVQSPGFIDISAIPSQPLLGIENPVR